MLARLTTGFEQEAAPSHFCCTVCFNLTVPYTTLAPCGHTLCGACAAKVSTCPECRSVIDDRVHSRQLDDVVRQSLRYNSAAPVGGLDPVMNVIGMIAVLQVGKTERKQNRRQQQTA